MAVHKSFYRTSDFILGTIIGIGLFLEWLLPTDLPINKIFSMIIGILILLSAWATILAVKHQFKKSNQKTGPGNETTSLIKGGILRYSRNPIYVAVLCISSAIGLLINSWWLILGIIPMYFLLLCILILPEEKYLLSIFGDEYRNYTRKVRRWI